MFDEDNNHFYTGYKNGRQTIQTVGCKITVGSHVFTFNKPEPPQWVKNNFQMYIGKQLVNKLEIFVSVYTLLSVQM